MFVYIITIFLLPISNLLGCSVGSSFSPLEHQKDSLQKVQQHAQTIEALTFELQDAQQSQNSAKEKILIQKIKEENQALQKSAESLKKSLKVSQEDPQNSSPHPERDESP